MASLHASGSDGVPVELRAEFVLSPAALGLSAQRPCCRSFLRAYSGAGAAWGLEHMLGTLPWAPVGLECRGIVLAQSMLERANQGGQQPACGGVA